MRIIFLGSPEFAVPSLRKLVEAGHDVAHVVTRPDRPRGRGLKVSPSAIKKEALRLGLNVADPTSVNDGEFLASMRALQTDLGVVVAFGRILSAEFLDVPRLGCVNVHASLLPKYRGAAPIQYALMNGETETGVTIQHVAVKLDSGDIITQRRIAIGPEDTLGSLEQRLAPLGAELLADALFAIASSAAPRIPQEDSQATFAPSIKVEDAKIDWGRSSPEIVNRVRAFNPRPGAWSIFRGNPIKVWRAAQATLDATEPLSASTPGTVVEIKLEGPIIQSGDGLLQILEVQSANRKSMSGRDWANGVRLKAVDRFE